MRECKCEKRGSMSGDKTAVIYMCLRGIYAWNWLKY